MKLIGARSRYDLHFALSEMQGMQETVYDENADSDGFYSVEIAGAAAAAGLAAYEASNHRGLDGTDDGSEAYGEVQKLWRMKNLDSNKLEQREEEVATHAYWLARGVYDQKYIYARD